MGLKWHGKKVQMNMKDQMNKRLAAAAITWVNHVKGKMNEKTNRDGKTPSAPGQYPSMVTSNLRGKIEWEAMRQRLAVRVGTNVEYGKFLELGTRKMRKRPWMTLANRETRATIKRILSKRISS